MRKPPGLGPNSSGQNMPRLNGEADTSLPLTLTALQYRLMHRWASGEFDPDPGLDLDAAVSFDEIPEIRRQVWALDRAGLDTCSGGSFYPGIEASRIMREPWLYSEPFRVRDAVPESALTGGLALPWQADFQACGEGWWPAQRPTRVLRDARPVRGSVRGGPLSRHARD
jgi:hypothetical protein